MCAWSWVGSKRLASAVIVGASVLAVAARAEADPKAYAVSSTSAFGMLDLGTGAFEQVGTVSGIGSGLFGDITRLPGGPLYAQLSDQTLAIIAPESGAPMAVGSTGTHGIYAIKLRSDGVLFGASNSDLYTIDTATADATLVGAFGVSPSSYFDLSFDDQDQLFLTQSSGNLYRVNAASGEATVVGPIGFSVVGAHFEAGTLYGFTLDSKIISIDLTTGAGTELSPETPSGTTIFAAASAVDPLGAGGEGGGSSGESAGGAAGGEPAAGGQAGSEHEGGAPGVIQGEGGEGGEAIGGQSGTSTSAGGRGGTAGRAGGANAGESNNDKAGAGGEAASAGSGDSAGLPASDDSGCGCSVPRRQSNAPFALFAISALGVLARRRRSSPKRGS